MNNTNLNALRKSFYELNLQEDLLSVLGRKYFPDKWHDKHELSVSEFIEEQDLPLEIASVVRKALHMAGTQTTTRVKKLAKKKTGRNYLSLLSFILAGVKVTTLGLHLPKITEI